MELKYPVYVISKDRADCCVTSRELDKMGVDHKVVIEPVDFEKYCETIGEDKLLVLPFSNLGQGSIPARNWVWEHSIEQGAKRHWILDDNIYSFIRLNKNTKIKLATPTPFRCIEDFTDRYTNVGMSGFNYQSFCIATQKFPAYYANTRIYSCILIKNDLEHRWRGRYNEDTDLSLRVLKDGWCTILSNAFIIDKATTLTMKGGNTDNVYTDGDKRMKFTQSLVDQHPDVVKVAWKFNRWHHQVDYTPFKKNKLVKIDSDIKYNEIDEYGMKMIELKGEK